MTSYAHAYLLLAPGLLTSTAQEQFGKPIHGILIVKTADGYVVLYEPFPGHLVTALGGSPEKWDGGGLLFVQDWPKVTVADVLQIVTGNAAKICLRSGDGEAGNLEIPKDREDAVAESVNPKLSQAGMSPPEIQIVVENRSAGGAHPGGRLRIISPVVALKDGPARAFSWLFVDIWFRELSWDIAQKGLSDQLAVNDLLALNLLAAGPPAPAPKMVEATAERPLQALENIITEFETLIAKENVDEVRDILPFLAKQAHWVMLSPTARQVWPEKMLGNKWRVDFVVRESDDRYVATEIESPKKRLYKTGDNVDPYAEWTHAEQQVRDYCNFIDNNRDYVEREEGLPGIHKPRGVVVIGRRETLTDEGKRKLAERNADNGRFRAVTFDDLLDQARTVLLRLRSLISP